jgi:hypothetical protein
MPLYIISHHTPNCAHVCRERKGSEEPELTDSWMNAFVVPNSLALNENDRARLVSLKCQFVLSGNRNPQLIIQRRLLQYPGIYYRFPHDSHARYSARSGFLGSN